MRVLVLARYPPRVAPSQRYRFEQYVAPLAERGIRLEVHSLFDLDGWHLVHAPGRHGAKAARVVRAGLARLRDVLGAARYDAALVPREAFPLGPALFERVLAARGVPYLFDFDDAIYLPSTSETNRIVAPLRFPGRAAAAARRAAVVVAGNHHLATWARRHAAHVRVIPSTIDMAGYGAAVDGRGEGPACIGFTGSPTTSANLLPVAPVLARLQRERGVRFRFIGDASFRLPGVVTEALDWREATEAEDLRALDIGLMPLPDTDWARGKCGMKALQYMALGIPAVVSPVGMNVDLAEGGGARLAGAPDEWHRVLDELIREPGERHRLGAAGRRLVIEHYSVEANVDAWAAALRETAGG